MKTDNIFSLLSDRGISLKELSEKTGISSGNISDWKSGRSTPKTDALVKISRFLGVSVDYLVHGPSKYLADLFSFLGKDKYYVSRIDLEDCICRRIKNYEIELSGCNRKKMNINLYLWELSDNGWPLHTVAHKFGIRSKYALCAVIDRIEENIDNIESITRFENIVDDGAFCIFDNGAERRLSNEEVTMLESFSKLDVLKQAQVVNYVAKLLELKNNKPDFDSFVAASGGNINIPERKVETPPEARKIIDEMQDEDEE